MIMQDRWKLFSLDRVKISATMVGQRRKIKKKTLAKTPYSSPPPSLKKKKKKMEQSINDSISHIRNSIHPHVSVYIIRIFVFNFRFSSRKSQSQQTSKKKDPFYNTVTIHFSFYEPQLTKHWKQYARATQPKTFVTLQTCFGLAS